MKKFSTKSWYALTIILCISLLSISIGFSAMSTSLSINGGISFKPVDMIRIISIEQKELNNVTETSHTHTIDTITTLLDINSIDGYATYQVTISNLGEVTKELESIDAEIFSNDQMEYEITGVTVGSIIKAKRARTFTITFKYKDGATISDTRLNVKLKFHFTDYVPVIDPNYQYESLGECTFSGPDNTLTGTCVSSTNGYINTGIVPFNTENYQKNFVLKFKIKAIDSSRFGAGKRDTIFNILYEGTDNEYGNYPGVLLRIEGTKWQLQGGDGRGSATKVQFQKNDLIGKEIRIIRHNDNGTIKLYYMIDSNEPVLLRNMTNLVKPFDTPLTFGANLTIDNINPDRYAYGTLEDLSFVYYDAGLSLNDLIGQSTTEPDDPIIDPDDPPVPPKPIPPVTFGVAGPCIFNGQNANMTGDSCTDYSDQKYINSGIYLYNSENYQKDFDISFNIDQYTPSNQEVTQVTLFNAFLERTSGRGYGMLLRRNSNNLTLIVRDGKGNDKEVNTPASSIQSFRIIRKNQKICYSINNGSFTFLIDNSNFSVPFDVPVTFGASLNSSGQPWRYIKGTLSDIKLTIGEIDPNVSCE